MLLLYVGNNEVNFDIIDNVLYKLYNVICLFDNMFNLSLWVIRFGGD